MPFGQQSGPPASARQLDELLERVHLAGFSDFREARHPLGLTQRQAAGRFSRDEAAALLDRLTSLEPGNVPIRSVDAKTSAASERLLRAFPAEQLAMELERRGWIVIAP